MTNSKEAKTEGEMDKVRDYLIDSKKNIERLKKGKKPRRKLRFLISEHKFLFTVISILVIVSPFIPLMLPGRPPIIKPPNFESVEVTVNLIEDNFTDQNGYPVHEKTVSNTSSELIILSSLTNSLLLQAGYLPSSEEVLDKISIIFEILSNGSFRKIENLQENLTLTSQIIGIYSLIQSYYALEDTNRTFNFNVIEEVYSNLIYHYYSVQHQMFIQPYSNSSYLIDQALGLWLLTTYQLLFQQDYCYYMCASDYVQPILSSINIHLVNASTNEIYSEYNLTSSEASQTASALDLMYLAVGLSRAEKLRYDHYYFYYSSYYIHQRVISNFIDEEWLVHETDRTDDLLILKNQAYFSLISYLMNLENVGSEVVNATSLNYLFGNGFYENLTDKEITIESCLYGLIIFSSQEWAPIENLREYVEEPIQSSFAGLIWSILATIFMVYTVNRRTKRKKI